VEGPPGSVALAILSAAREPSDVRELAFGPDGIATADFSFGGGATRRVTLAVGNGSTTSQTIPLAYSLRLDGPGSVEASPPSVPGSTIYGTGVSASGTVTCNGAPAPLARLVLVETELVSGTSRSVDLVTDDFGNWRINLAPAVTSAYVVHVADPLLSSTDSPATTLGVRVAVNLTLSSDQVGEGESVTASGNVVPVHGGQIVLEIRRPNGQWQSAATTGTREDGSYSAEVSFPATGAWEVRARMPSTGDEDHLPGDSVAELVQVGQS
jgi:hypothetical protein